MSSGNSFLLTIWFISSTIINKQFAIYRNVMVGGCGKVCCKLCFILVAEGERSD